MNLEQLTIKRGLSNGLGFFFVDWLYKHKSLLKFPQVLLILMNHKKSDIFSQTKPVGLLGLASDANGEFS